jgi:hypothetical protein
MTKTLFIRYMKELGEGKFSWALEHNAGFKEVFHLTNDICKLLEEQSIPHVAFFTGGAGFRFLVRASDFKQVRILFRDPRLYFLVGWWQSYSTTFSTQVWPCYLTDVLKCPDQLRNKIIDYTDPNIYVTTEHSFTHN